MPFVEYSLLSICYNLNYLINTDVLIDSMFQGCYLGVNILLRNTPHTQSAPYRRTHDGHNGRYLDKITLAQCPKYSGTYKIITDILH